MNQTLGAVSSVSTASGSQTQAVRLTPSSPAAQVVLEDAPDRAHAVPPADLLAFGVGAARVRDAHLVDAPAAASDLGGDLRLHPEARLFDREAAHDLAAHQLVAG